MKKIFLLLLAMIFMAVNLSLAEEKADLKALSTAELEKRLDETDTEIDELEVNAEYLATEEPEDFDYAAGTVERSGFESEGTPRSKLLNPTAAKDTKKRLDSLYITKKDIEEELGNRMQSAR